MKQLQHRVYHILESNGETGSLLARVVNAVILLVIMLSVIMVILESYEPLYSAEKWLFDSFDLFSITFFTIECGLRLWARGAVYGARDGGAWRGRREYLLSFYGIVDLLAIVPFYLHLLFPGADMRIVRLLRLLRLLKISRYNTALEDLVRAVVAERRSFVATLYILSIAVTLTSALMYYAEHSSQPDKLPSIAHTMYWSLITLTTVGYGDISPVTPIGQLIATVTALLGVSAVAMLTGIVASSFANQMARRRHIFEEELRKAYADGILSQEEQGMLAQLQERFDMSDEEVTSMQKHVIETRLRKKHGG